MKLKQRLYDLLGRHKAKVGEAQTAMEAGELERAETLTKEAQGLSGEIEKLKALIAEQERYGGDGEGGAEPQKSFPLQQEDAGADSYREAVKAFAQAAREGFPGRRLPGT